MRTYQYRKFQEEVEKQIRKQVNRGWTPEKIQFWLLTRIISMGSGSITGTQIGELMDMIPGEYRIAG